jgi:hypothetical protein
MRELFLGLFLVSVVVLVRNPFARGSRFNVLLGGVATLGMLGSAGWALRSSRELRRMAEPAFYPLPSGPGVHKIRVQPVRGVPGLQASVVRVGTTDEAPGFEPERFWDFAWRVEADAPVHVHDKECPCSHKRFIVFDEFSEKLRDRPVGIEYRVGPEIRGLLDGAQLKVQYPFSFGNDIAMGGCADAWAQAIGVGMAVIGLLGVALQVRRLRSKARAPSATAPGPSTSGPPAPSPPATS